MTTPNNPDTNNDQDDFLNTDQNDRQQDINNSDAAKFTEDAEEQAMLETIPDNQLADNTYNTIESTYQPLTTPEAQAEMGGATNLSLDQLKKAHHPEE